MTSKLQDTLIASARLTYADVRTHAFTRIGKHLHAHHENMHTHANMGSTTFKSTFSPSEPGRLESPGLNFS